MQNLSKHDALALLLSSLIILIFTNYTRPTQANQNGNLGSEVSNFNSFKSKNEAPRQIDGKSTSLARFWTRSPDKPERRIAILLLPIRLLLALLRLLLLPLRILLLPLILILRALLQLLRLLLRLLNPLALLIFLIQGANLAANIARIILMIVANILRLIFRIRRRHEKRHKETYEVITIVEDNKDPTPTYSPCPYCHKRPKIQRSHHHKPELTDRADRRLDLLTKKFSIHNKLSDEDFREFNDAMRLGEQLAATLQAKSIPDPVINLRKSDILSRLNHLTRADQDRILLNVPRVAGAYPSLSGLLQHTKAVGSHWHPHFR